MKKKVLFTICGVVVIVAIVSMLIFVMTGKNDTIAKTINVEGTWKVAVYVNNNSVSIVDNEYMVFDADTVRDFRDNTTVPFVTSAYTIDSNLLMELLDISRKYSIEKKTDNYIRLYESQDTYLELIKYQNSDMSMISVEDNILEGRWNIEYRNTSNVYAGDYMTFENGNVSQYKAGDSKPVATSDFSVRNGHLIVEGWGKDMVIYPVSDDSIMMVELTTDNGFIWEFKKAE